MCGSVSESPSFSFSKPSSPPSPPAPSKSSTPKAKQPKAKAESTTTFIRSTLKAAVKKIQRSNTWTTHQDLDVVRDSQGKERHAFCSRGAICSVLAGKNESTAMDEAKGTKKYRSIEKALMVTYRQDPTKYGKGNGKGDRATTLTGFNDDYAGRHSNVVKLFRDTIDRLG